MRSFRYSFTVLVLGLFLQAAALRAQDTTLVSSLMQMRQQVDASLGMLQPILEGEPLATWDGRSGLAPAQVHAIMNEVGAILEDLHGPLEAFSTLAEATLAPPSLAPVLDDAGIAARDLDLAIAQLPIAAHAHEAETLHAIACKHDNVPMRKAVELVRDISATLALISGTLELFGISDTQ